MIASRGLIAFQACLRPVDGCVHPRQDLNPEADRNTTCDFYDIYYDLEHIWSDSTVMTDSTLMIDKDSNQYYIDQLQFFLFQSHLSTMPAPFHLSVILPIKKMAVQNTWKTM